MARIPRFIAVSITACLLPACWLVASYNDLVEVEAGTGDAAQADGLRPDAGDAMFLPDVVPPSDATVHDSDAGTALDGGVPDSTPTSEGGDAAGAGCLTTPYSASVLADNPLAYFRLDEASGPTAADLSGHGNSGTYSTTGLTYSQPGAIKNDSDTAVVFDGTSGMVTVGNQFQFLVRAPFSLEAWINAATSDGEYRGVASNESGTLSSRQGYLLYVHTLTGTTGFERWGGTMSDPTAADAAVAVGSWVHLVGTFDGFTLLLYVNGVQRDMHVASISLAMAPNVFVIGALFGGMMPSNFAGTIDEVAVYDHALGARCVQAHFNIGQGMAP